MSRSVRRADVVSNDRLLAALAEELKLPLLQIARQAELANQADIEMSASQALWFVDSYLLSQQLLQQSSLELEPVAVSSVLQDAAQTLDSLAKQYNCGLELSISGRFMPAMAHRQALETALVGLGSSLITASQDKKPRLILAAHRTQGGVVAGVFSSTDGLSQAVFQRGLSLYGKARQPMQELTSHTGAGIFVAAELLSSMESILRVAKHHKLTGLAATLQQSRQLALI
ncbi:MAG: hypothetical protein WCJ24_01695 [Candidatus Saccharibacteria bacterium]